MKTIQSCITWIALCAALSATGCTRYLAATPNVLRDTDPELVFESCPADCQRADAPVLYATDRANEAKAGETPVYGSKRGNSLAFGVVNVRLNPNPSWKELVAASTQGQRGREFALALADIQQVGIFRRGRDYQQVQPDGVLQAQSVIEQANEEASRRKQFQRILSDRLAQTQRKDVYIFVHGYNNTFEDSVFRAAEVWHFMGRGGVPVAYTWPAGWGGIRGYAYDRESGEFTVSHLRRFIKTIAECPDVERVHLIAHSRGADVTITALRELHLGYAAQGKSTQEALKLENLVLAAPDLDEEVFMQRYVGENMLNTAKRTTLYASGRDRAIEFADVIFASRRRLGMLVAKDFSPKLVRALAKLPNVQFIECKVTGSYLSHDYIFTHPAALSDLILVLRDRLPPGADNGRPLRQPTEGTWELTDDYHAR